MSANGELVSVQTSCSCISVWALKSALAAVPPRLTTAWLLCTCTLALVPGGKAVVTALYSQFDFGGGGLISPLMSCCMPDC